MDELIEISNFLLINYWWLVLPICAVLGTVMFLISESYFSNFKNEVVDKSLIDGGMKWDKYGNPIFDEDEENN